MNSRIGRILAIGIVSGVMCGMGMSAQAQSLSWPVSDNCSVYISTYYGPRGQSFHNGIDIACGGDIDIYAAADGDVVSETTSSGQCTYDPGYGTCRVCDNSMGNSLTIQHANGYKTVYMHLKQKLVHSGAHVKCGDVIGKMGTTGCSTGQHLHFSVWINSSHYNPFDYVTIEDYTCPVGGFGGGLELISVYEPQNTDIDGDGVAEIFIRGALGLQCIFPKKDIATKAVISDVFSNDNGWDKPQYYTTFRFADVNGDGKSDVCARDSGGLRCYLSNGTSFTQGGFVAMSDADGYDDVKYYSTIKMADINGDGKADFCARFKDSFKCYLSNGSGFESSAVSVGDLGDNQGWGNVEYYSTIRVADVNGDGKADVCGRGISGWRCWHSQGNAFGAQIDGPALSDPNWAKPEYYSTIRMPDINGDGKADLCARDSNGIRCHLSTGNGWSNEIRGPEWSDAGGWNNAEYYHPIQFGDLNGDGKDDICSRGYKGVQCFLSTGNGFDTTTYLIEDFGDPSKGNVPAVYHTIHMGDMNGDGKMDICGRNSETAICFAFNGSGFDRFVGAPLSDTAGWNGTQYASTYRFGGPLKKACVSSAEVCDGRDNDCDGQIDEDNVCGTPCQPSEEVCDGQDNDCDDEVDEGGVCDTPCQPSEEVCDGQDNDCDDEVDEGGVCDTPCQPSEEVCDGQDNDCDNEVDEGGVCDTPCQPSEEVCDGVDNDCDEAIDEDGVCDNCEPSEEICDGRDNDCDHEIDEGDVCGSNPGPGPEPGPVDPGSDTETEVVFYDEDCGCSTSRPANPTGAMPWALAIGAIFGGLFLRRRRRN